MALRRASGESRDRNYARFDTRDARKRQGLQPCLPSRYAVQRSMLTPGKMQFDPPPSNPGTQTEACATSGYHPSAGAKKDGAG
jgi:hypothetical protein